MKNKQREAKLPANIGPQKTSVVRTSDFLVGFRMENFEKRLDVKNSQLLILLFCLICLVLGNVSMWFLILGKKPDKNAPSLQLDQAKTSEEKTKDNNSVSVHVHYDAERHGAQARVQVERDQGHCAERQGSHAERDAQVQVVRDRAERYGAQAGRDERVPARVQVVRDPARVHVARDQGGRGRAERHGAQAGQDGGGRDGARNGQPGWQFNRIFYPQFGPKASMKCYLLACKLKRTKNK